jgi:hypothetical protein
MYELVHKYLLLTKKVGVPGIGSFVIDIKSAQFSDSHEMLLPPKPFIAFKSDTAIADKRFYSFVAKEMRIEEIDAIKKFHDFAYQLRANASQPNGILFPGMGIIRQQVNGGFLFEEENNLKDFFPPLPLPETLANKDAYNNLPYNTNPEDAGFVTDEDTTPRDLWWLYAALLALAGIAAIAYYFRYLD